MAIRAFLGTWEVMKFNYNNGIHAENSGLEGVKFRLDETGDVTWTVNEELKTVPLFSCETYELYSTTSGIILVVILRFGAYAGHVIEFRCDQSTVDQLWVALRKGEQMEHMSLTCEGWCILQCKRIIDEPKENNNHIPFSLLPALEDGYFSDVIIMASNKKHFKVHSNILQLLGITIPWQSNPVPFSNLPENVLGTILHFLYSECLPNSLDEATAHEVIQAVQSYPCLSKLVDMCKLYLKNTALKQQIIGLVNDMHASINQVIDHFNNRNTLSPTEITSNPENLCYVIKQSVREAAVASAKLLMLCDLFTKRKNELSRDERHEIIIYAKSRLPIFLMQLLKFLQAFKSTFSTMSPSQRQEVAMFLVPEIEIILDTVSMIILEIERALQQIIQVLSPHETPKPKTSMGDMLGKSLKNVLHIREITKLRNIHEQITCTLELLLSKKEHFNEMTPSQKVRSVARNLEQVIEELPIFLFRLEELTAALDDKVEWREFKFCFKVGTSKVSGILQKLVAHRETLQDVLIQVCELVQREQFTQSMQNLQLLSVPSTRSHSSECPKGSKANSFDTPNSQQHQSYKLSLVESLCIPPTSLESNLSKLSLQLLNSGIGTDMEFEVVSNNSSVQQTMREHSNEAVSPIEDERTVMKAHRVIVASRCDWFRRALLSGMREAIDKKIVIHDTNSFLFKVFLEYLYSGRIKQSGLSNEQYAELLLLSDRYEVDSLKQCCEYALKSSIDLESVLYYLSMADQFNARYLRNACLSFISQNHQLAETELFYELPIALQAEIFNCIWSQPPTHKSSSIDQPLATPSSPDTSLSDIPKGLSEVNLAGQQAHSNCSSMEDFPSEDTVRLEQCISKLRDILGDSAPREKLVQIVLAADYDLCRAINYFYERNGDDE